MSRITSTSLEGQSWLHGSEACRLVAYKDGGGVWTIGWGTTHPRGGHAVQAGDACTQAQADAWFAYDLKRFELAVDNLTVDTLTQRQFDVLVNVLYNIGEPGFRDSSIRRLVNANPNDPAIRGAMMKWCRDRKTPSSPLLRVPGLWTRRHREADHYFGVVTPCPPFPGP